MKAWGLTLAAAGAFGFASFASAQTINPAPLSPAQQRNVERLRDAALASDNAYEIVTDLVTEIGPRQAGTPAEARARAWAVAMLREQGFSNIRIEPFTHPFWDATREEAAIITPTGPRPLVITALGGSAPADGLEAEVVRFPTIAALNAAPNEAVAGRIVYINEPMARTQDGSGYGAAVAKRSACAPAAQAKGAAACIIRAVGTNEDRLTHQGGRARQNDGAHLPSAALSPADSDVLTRLLAEGPVRLRLDIEVDARDSAPSGNVLAEIRGRERPTEIVLAAAHLDSWDLGVGAIDDGAGVAIITAAAKLVNDLPGQPRRTIRVFLAGNEEQGGLGGIEYWRVHSGETHVVASESDAGADRVFRMRSRFGEGALPFARAMQDALAPLAILRGDNLAEAGTDIDPLQEAGVPIVQLSQDMTRYFDVHHTANDALHMVDPEQLRQNVAAWAIFLYLAADSDWDFRAAPVSVAAP